MHDSTRILKALRKAGLGKGPSFVIDPKVLARVSKRHMELMKEKDHQETIPKWLQNKKFKGAA